MAEKTSSLGLEGMDAISFFEDSKPKRGSFEFKAVVNGLTYCFRNQANLDRFLKNPAAFLPQFGGHCAFYCGLLGKLKPGSAKAWKIINGKLYLTGGPNVFWLWKQFPALIGRGHDHYRAPFVGKPSHEPARRLSR
jgi:YHS domain-containing protein